jgi:hypothetical protein
MKWFVFLIVVAWTFTVGLVAAPRAAVAEAKVMGWVEWALVSERKVRMRAKLDTGARSSSINADEIEEFRRNGRDWVRFVIRNRKGESARYERPVHRWVRIRRAGARTRRRAVVLLGICIGDHYLEAQVNLASRERMNYALLIGRRFLDGRIFVDSSRRYTTEPNCKR